MELAPPTPDKSANRNHAMQDGYLSIGDPELAGRSGSATPDEQIKDSAFSKGKGKSKWFKAYRRSKECLAEAEEVLTDMPSLEPEEFDLTLLIVQGCAWVRLIIERVMLCSHRC